MGVAQNSQVVVTTHCNTITSALNTEIPDGAIITITTCCGDCDFREDSGAGTKPVCSNRNILASRPYSTGEKSRAVDRTKIPEWCPLRAKGFSMSIPESIPEDRKQSFPCECGGSISWAEGLWECDTCDFKIGGDPT